MDELLDTVRTALRRGGDLSRLGLEDVIGELGPAALLPVVRLVAREGPVGSAVPGPGPDLEGWRRLYTAAELLGHAEAALELARTHALTREQFGRPIGAFQAVKHLLADMAVHTVALGHLVDAASVENAAATNAYAADASLRVCEQALQVLGGIGFVREHPLWPHYEAVLRLHGTPSALRRELARDDLARR